MSPVFVVAIVGSDNVVAWSPLAGAMESGCTPPDH